MAKKHVIRNVVRAVLGEAWLILPEKLEAMIEVLEMRSNGNTLSEEEITAKFGTVTTEDEADEPQIVDGVQVIDVFGVLSPRINMMARISGGTSTQQFAKQIRAAAEDQSVKSVILRVDSPGGAASYTPEAAAAVRELGKVKRVVTSATNSMASGAYWIGTAANETFASPSTDVGSIGVFMVLRNVQKAAEESGVNFQVFRSGELKGAGNPYEALTDDRRAVIQNQMDAIYANFLADVSQQTNQSISVVESRFGQGSTFLAAEAASRGMINGVATFEQVLEAELKRGLSVAQPFFVIGGNMDIRVKAALLARGLVTADVSDEAADVALETVCKVLNVSSKTESDKLVAMILGSAPGAVSTPVVPTANDDNKDDEDTPDLAKVRHEAELAATARVMDIQARGAVLGIGTDEVEKAIKSGKPVGDVLKDWTSGMAKKEQPFQNIGGGEAQSDKISSAASALICQRASRFLPHITLSDEEQKSVDNYGGDLKNRKLLDVVRILAQSNGQRVTHDNYTDAEAYLRQDGQILTADGDSVNRRGDHADLLSALTRKALSSDAIVAPVTYPQWCQQVEDLPDFKPKAWIDTGIYHVLDAITEDQEAKQLKMESEMETWIKVDRYAGKVGLTVEMIVDDDIGGFARMLAKLPLAAKMTVHRAIMALFHSNPVLLDGERFFSAAHTNLGTGAAVSHASLSEHRKLHRRQKSFGSEWPMGITLDRILAPATLEGVVLQTIVPQAEVKTPATDATINTFRGLVTPIVDSHLDDYSTAAWYTLLNPAVAAAVVYAYQSSFGENGRQTEWFEDSTKTRWVENETRFGVAMGNYRAMVKNAGP